MSKQDRRTHGKPSWCVEPTPTMCPLLHSDPVKRTSLLNSKEHQLELVCMGRKLPSRLHPDSTASEGIASRIGLGTIRHLITGFALDTAPRESTNHPDQQSGQSREQSRHWNERHERRDPRGTDESNELRRHDGKTPASTESCSHSRLQSGHGEHER